MILGIVELKNKALTNNMLAETKIEVYWWVRTFHALVCVRNFNHQNDYISLFNGSQAYDVQSHCQGSCSFPS